MTLRLAWLVPALVACAPAIAAPRSDTAKLTIGGAEIEVVIEAGHLDAPRAELLAWVSTAASGVAAYFGRFPVARYRLVIEPRADRTGVLRGTTWAHGGARSRVFIGEHTRAEHFARDWILTHEMIHTSFPDQPDEHKWIEEGIATYVEPLARAWVGNIPAGKVWTDLVDGLPNGLPAAGDRGLDHTHTWGRTYWGGALFCLVADLEIRERTQGRRGLVDALRGMITAGGNSQADWTIDRAFHEADKAIGVPVLEDVYRRMKDAPVDVDLPALWRELGVKVTGDELVLDDAAPKAAVRRAITARPASAGSR